MRALRFDRFGGPEVLHVTDVPEPVPRAGEIKVRVHAVSLNPLDWKVRDGHLRLLPVGQPPRGLGVDFAGTIVGTGGGATDRHVGERVFGCTSPFARDGALAEFLTIAAAKAAPIPDALDFAAAAALPVAGGTALQALTDVAGLAAGQRALITGAAGGVGHFGVQIAKHLGAHVVGVCSAANVAFVRELGADEVIDYAREDFTQCGGRYDVVFDAAGASSFGASRAVLAPAGVYINTCGTAGGAIGTAIAGVFARFKSRQRAVAFQLKPGTAAWRRLAELAAQGVLRPRIERTIGLEDVAEAQRAMATGHGRGKIVVQVAAAG